MPEPIDPSSDPGAIQPINRPPGSMHKKAEQDLPLPEELARLLPPGTYTVDSFVGQGGMGAVYKGTQVRLQRIVAIKIMRRDASGERGFEERFRREALAMAHLNHPHILNVIDYGEAGAEFLYIVMEFIDGADLMEVIRTGRMTQEMALTLLPQIFDALQFAHDHGIVHRDIKPGNVMLTRDGRVKIADFGLAKHHDVESSFRTQTGAGMGTPDYAAPEQLYNVTSVDHRADLYALGVMIYHMVTGHLPRGVWQPPSQRADVDPHWDDIVSRAMEADPKDRYASASEMKAAVSRITLRSEARDAPVMLAPVAPGSGTNGAIRRDKRRRLRIFGIAILIPSLACVAIAYHLLEQTPDRQPVKSSPPLPLPLPPPPPPFTATKGAPFINSLGMKFVPVPGTGGTAQGKQVLFSVWETRVQDYDVFARETRREWPPSGLEQGATHPAVNVNWDDAQAFCAWLTERERKAGRIAANDRYRLPSDHEWSCAIGLGEVEDANRLPKEKAEKQKNVYPWGSAWPPPQGAGNYAGEEIKGVLNRHDYIKGAITGYRDESGETAPAGSFPPNDLGLYDLSGNVWEWCEDWFDDSHTQRVLRGGAWDSNDSRHLLSSYRSRSTPYPKYATYGFRCVLDNKTVSAVSDDRDAVEWVLRVGGRVTVLDGNKRIVTRDVKALPSGKVVLAGVDLGFAGQKKPAGPINDLAPLAGLRNLETLYVSELSTITDEDLGVLASMPRLQSVSFHGCKLTDAAFTAFAAVKNLNHLSVFNNTAITGKGLPAITRLPKLEKLNIACCGLTDEGIVNLKAFPNLTYLSVGGTRFNDSHLSVLDGMSKLTGLDAGSGVTVAGVAAHSSLSNISGFTIAVDARQAEATLASLARACPNLQNLDVDGIGNADLTAQNLAGLGAFARLRSLRLAGPGITDATLAAVPRLKEVHELVLLQTSAVTESGLATLRSAEALTSIQLFELKITDAALPRLAELKSLKKLDIGSCPAVTDAGIAAFKKSRPDVTVLR